MIGPPGAGKTLLAQRLPGLLPPAEILRSCPLQRESRALLRAAIERLELSARAFHHVVKLARTCADLAGAADIRAVDVCEAVQLRSLDRAP
jgi:magnesium chelatase family protein